MLSGVVRLFDHTKQKRVIAIAFERCRKDAGLWAYLAVSVRFQA